jgi:hypothetical protein
MIMALLTSQILCDIFKKCMRLSIDQIWIANQRREIPSDKKLYVIVGLMSSMPYGNNNVRNSDSGTKDTLSQYVKEVLTVDLLSYDTSCKERYNEILGSLVSTYSETIQESHALRIFPIPQNISDVSNVEGPTMLNRLSITLQALRKYDMILDIDNYYDNFEDPESNESDPTDSDNSDSNGLKIITNL